MKIFMKIFRTVCIILFIGFILWALCFHLRYQYLTIKDIHLKTPVLRDVLLNNEIYRPIRFDRWTGKVEIYLEPGIWSDMAQWNKEKYQTIQTSVKELSRVN